MKQALEHHIEQQDQVDEYTFCLGCSQIVYLHDRDNYETCQDGVTCKRCAKAQRATDIEQVEATFDGFTERAIERAAVANGISRKAVRLVLDL